MSFSFFFLSGYKINKSYFINKIAKRSESSILVLICKIDLSLRNNRYNIFMRVLFLFLSFLCVLNIGKSDDSIELDNICFAFEDDVYAPIFLDIAQAMFNATGIIDKNNLKNVIFKTDKDQETVDAFESLGKSGKCGTIFTKFKKIRTNSTAVKESNMIYNKYNMYAINSVLGTIPICYNRLIRGYLSCEPSFKCILM